MPPKISAVGVINELLSFFGNYPERYTVGAYARNRLGVSVAATSRNARQWDTLGALRLLYGTCSDSNPYSRALADAVGVRVTELSTWHDSHETVEGYRAALTAARNKL